MHKSILTSLVLIEHPMYYRIVLWLMVLPLFGILFFAFDAVKISLSFPLKKRSYSQLNVLQLKESTEN